MTAVEQQAESGGPAQQAQPGEPGQQAQPGEPAGPGAEAAAPSTPPASPAPSPAPAASAAPAGPSAGSIVSAFGVGLTLLAVLVLGFAGYLYFLSGVQEARTQTTMYASLRGELGLATAPLGSPTPGTPMAILNIPAIGMRNVVVVEGTSPENLMLGPGRLRDTALPGQAGVSVLYGRRATFGAPFARVPQLKPGDKIVVTTGQGTAVYQVKLVGDSKNRILVNPATNQLMLITADSTLIPSHYIEVDANLVSTAQANPGGNPSVSPAEIALGNDPNALILCMAWGMALVIVSVGGTMAATRWSRWPAYLATLPIALAVVWNLYENLAALLPNIY
jgi:sortase A